MDTLVLSYQQKKSLIPFAAQTVYIKPLHVWKIRAKGHGTSSNMLNNAESSIHMWDFG